MSELSGRISGAQSSPSPGEDFDFGTVISSPTERPRVSGKMPPSMPASGDAVGLVRNGSETLKAGATEKSNSKKGKGLWFAGGSGKIETSPFPAAPGSELDEKGAKVTDKDKSAKMFTGFSRMVRSMTRNAKGSDREDSTKLADVPGEFTDARTSSLESDFAGADGLTSPGQDHAGEAANATSSAPRGNTKSPNNLSIDIDENVSCNVADLGVSNIFRPFSPQESKADENQNVVSPSRETSSACGSSSALTPGLPGSATPAGGFAQAHKHVASASPAGADSDEEHEGKFDDADD
ncbi:hypothetical protein FVE85_0313 [Porphyridium purpureum]|uniref:Uncharacterized protein n=1 Tax=Porphyridium purpureum TaxID=35688 RepID=A0A5J4Z0U7_PORPP|nr:hypothetical protein FVE85_0313 [Porphyridium purpureum]|eukprot:POR5143..scf208_2